MHGHEFRGGLLMRPSRESIAGILSIAILVGTGVWYARHPEFPSWFQAASHAGGESPPHLPEDSVGNVEWSADGRRLLVRSRTIGGHTDTLTLHSVVNGEGSAPVDTAGHTKFFPALDPDGIHVVLGTMVGELCRIDVESSETTTLAQLPRKQEFSRVVVTQDGRRHVAAAATSSGRILVCDLNDLTVTELAPCGNGSVCALRCSRDGEHLASSHSDGSIAVWDLASGKLQRVLAGSREAAYDIAFLHDDTRIIAGALDDSIRIFDIASGREEWRDEFGLRGVRALDVSPDGRTAAWGGFDQRVIVWDLEHRRKKFECRTAARFVTTVRFSPDGTILAVAGFEGTVRLFDAQSGAERKGLIVGGGDPDRSHSGASAHSSLMQ
jgi:WD40 repeat protein